MAGYIRQDVTNNIATGNVINASDFDNEYNAIEAAFHASTGHTHDGTAAEGAPITKIGPTQDVVASASALTPKTDNTVDLGSSILEYKDLWIDGTANIDSLVADTADINAGTIDGVTIGGASAGAGTFTTLTTSSTVTLNGGTANGVLYLNGSKVATSGTALAFDGTNLGVGVTDFSVTGANAKFAVGAGTINLDDGQFLAWGGGGGRTFVAGDKATGFMRFGISGTEQMRLTSTGLGIGTSSPGAKLDIVGVTQWQAAAGTVLGKLTYSGGDPVVLANTGLGLQFFTNNAFAAKIDSSGNLGIGTSSPSVKLDVASTGNTVLALRSTSSGSPAYYIEAAGGGTPSIVYKTSQNLRFATADDSAYTNYSERMRLDASGNLGLGVTPSAWSGVLSKALEFNNGCYVTAYNTSGTDSIYVGANNYYNGSNYIYKNSRAASQYQQTGGAHYWFTAASGTAGNAISFTQAMTLTANSELIVGTTSTGGALRVYGSSGKIIIGDSSFNYFDADTQLFRNFAGTERARITSGGDLGIGTSSPGSKLDVQGNALIGDGTDRTPNSNWNGQLNIRGNSYTGGISLNATGMWVGHNSTARDLIFATDETERARITSGGDLLVGTTDSSMTTGAGFKMVPSATAPNMGIVGSDSANTSVTYRLYSTGAAAYRFYVGYGGTIYATSTTITSLSDQRLKENIQDIDVGLDKVMALRPRKFDWKAGKGKDKKGDRGWIAQEFEQVFPDMVDTWQDPAPEGEEPYKAVNADLIPVLVKAIQELKAELDATKARLAALEAA